MKINKNIVLVIPFYGVLPFYFNIFLKGVKENPEFSFYIFADKKPEFDLPSNVKYFCLQLSDLIAKINEVTNCNFNTIPGHKLCDFRPFFGLIFADFLNNADFWGYCDIDMLFGKLNNFFLNRDFEDFDFISAHSEQFVGHFTLIKNTNEINRLCFKIPNWKVLCSNPIAQHVDEERFSNLVKSEGKFQWKKPKSFDQEILQSKCSHALTFSFKGKVADSCHKGLFHAYWENGELFLKIDKMQPIPLIYVHFMGIKNWWHWSMKSGFNLCERYSFSRIGNFFIRDPEDLKTVKYRTLYLYQGFLYFNKTVSGCLLKFILPVKMQKEIRKFFKV